jgi:hypothetical protein
MCIFVFIFHILVLKNAFSIAIFIFVVVIVVVVVIIVVVVAVRKSSRGNCCDGSSGEFGDRGDRDDDAADFDCDDTVRNDDWDSPQSAKETESDRRGEGTSRLSIGILLISGGGRSGGAK